MIRTITILGAGTMGHGIAKCFAQAGLPVTVYDPSSQALALSRARMQAPAVRYCGTLEEAIPGADLVIESATEDMAIKLALYAELEQLLSPAAIVASNTSSYSLKALASGRSFANRMLITHFFNPAHIIPLVEIVQSADTESHVTTAVVALLAQCGKVPVVLNKDISGFVANRLQAALLREACYLLAEQVASAEQIDTIVKEGIGLRWAVSGPFEIADRGGLDVWKKVLENLLPVLDNRTQVPGIITQKVSEGHLGAKTGKGLLFGSGEAMEAGAMAQKLLRLLNGRS